MSASWLRYSQVSKTREWLGAANLRLMLEKNPVTLDDSEMSLQTT